MVVRMQRDLLGSPFGDQRGMGGMKETLGTRPNGRAQPLFDRGAMSFLSEENFVNCLTGRHRPPFTGQVKEALALLGG